MTIHSAHPFAGGDREAERQFRGRLGGRVSLWTSGTLDAGGLDVSRALHLDEQVRRAELDAHAITPEAGGRRPVGLTVTSMIAVPGPQWRLVGAIDPDSDLGERLAPGDLLVVSLLSWRHRVLADVFAGLAPAPGGGFRAAEFEQTDWGPRLSSADTWAGARVETIQPEGWSTLVTAVTEHVQAGTDDEALHHVRGDYRTF